MGEKCEMVKIKNEQELKNIIERKGISLCKPIGWHETVVGIYIVGQYGTSIPVQSIEEALASGSEVRIVKSRYQWNDIREETSYETIEYLYTAESAV